MRTRAPGSESSNGSRRPHSGRSPRSIPRSSWWNRDRRRFAWRTRPDSGRPSTRRSSTAARQSRTRFDSPGGGSRHPLRRSTASWTVPRIAGSVPRNSRPSSSGSSPTRWSRHGAVRRIKSPQGSLHGTAGRGMVRRKVPGELDKAEIKLGDLMARRDVLNEEANLHRHERDQLHEQKRILSSEMRKLRDERDAVVQLMRSHKTKRNELQFKAKGLIEARRKARGK